MKKWGHHKFWDYVIQIGPVLRSTIWGQTRPLVRRLEKKISHFQPDVLLFTINGNKPERKVAGKYFERTKQAAFATKSGGKGTRSILIHFTIMF